VTPSSDGIRIIIISPILLLWDSEQDDKGAGHQGGAPPSEAGDAMDPGGPQRFCQAHRRQDGGQAASQHRLPRHGWPHEQDV
jgi:hypothetical protein